MCPFSSTVSRKHLFDATVLEFSVDEAYISMTRGDARSRSSMEKTHTIRKKGPRLTNKPGKLLSPPRVEPYILPSDLRQLP